MRSRFLSARQSNAGTELRAGARAAGLGTRRYQLGAYVAAAALYCTAGILLAGVVLIALGVWEMLGRGLLLVRAYAQDLAYCNDGTRNRVTLKINSA